MNTLEINKRYSDLAESQCCLSCGGAMDRSEPKPGEFCLDLGSGRGNDVLRLAGIVGNEGHAYGVDVAEGMIEKSLKTKEKLGIVNATFLRAELDQIPLPDESVHLVISNCTINHAPDKQAVWNEMYRVLKPGGRFVISDIYAIEPVPEEYRDNPEAVAECWAGAVTREEYLNQILAARFGQLSILEESVPYEKGKIKVVSWTIRGYKVPICSCCG